MGFWQESSVIPSSFQWSGIIYCNWSKSPHALTEDRQFSSVAQSCPTLCDSMNRSTPGLPVYHQHPESTQSHVHRVGDAIQPSHPLSSPFLLPSIFPSIRVFSNESALRIRWPKYWSFSFNISPSKEHPGPISFRMDWLDLLAVQGTLKNLLQHHMACNSEARPRDGKTEFPAQALLLPSYLTLGYLQDPCMSQFPHL